ncbi:MAG TPA: anaerobic ribonucleoside-triphosphate reductase activating protein [Candidatus Bathyarchaeia archaeon]|nr:anaerobic ribonucleoside-triphosphate reductase activating protein [Candidatus Bathyarchaeia archaeon]
MRIAGYLRTSLIEWPGNISAVIFVPGCNFRCPFCHNRDLVISKKVTRLQNYKEKEVLTDLRQRKRWIDGVVITGGEPTLQTDLSTFLKGLKRAGFLTMIETNGSRPEVIKQLVREELVDFWAMDYKAIFSDYENVVNIKKVKKKFRKNEALGLVKAVKRSMRLILKSGLPCEFRTTVVPTIHNEKVLIEMAKELKHLLVITDWLSPVKWVLQTFQPKNCLDQKYNNIKPCTRKKMKGFLALIREYIPEARLGF